MKSIGTKILIAIVVIIAFSGIIVISKYNTIVSKQEIVNQKLSDIDSVLQRRFDLIPNLVNTVKGYAAHEKEAIEKVTKARENYVNSSSLNDKASANNELNSALSNLLVIMENYPDLKANEQFKNLQDELAGTENRITVARKDYNEVVKEYNLLIKKFPNNIIAGIFNFGTKEYFEAEKKANEVPKVEF